MSELQPLLQEVTADYDRVKRIMSRARHPTFIGRDQVDRQTKNGGVIVWTMGGEDVAVSIVDVRRSCLLALSVIRQGVGIGSRVMTYVRPNWARVIDTKVEWFAKNGYTPVGRPMKARTLTTQIMMRNGLRSLGERIALIK